MNTLVIARLTFREALRRRALYGAIALTLAFLALYAWGTGVAVQELNREQTTAGGINRVAREMGLDLRLVAIGELLLAGLYAVSNIAALLAIFLGAVTIAQEIELGTLQSIIPKPIARWQVVLGKWLGGVAMLAVYVACTSAVAAAIIYWRAGYLPAQLPLGILLLVLKATLLYSLTLVGSTLAPMIATGVVMLIVFVVANVTAMIEQVGQVIGSEVMVRIGVVASLIVPSEALWRMGAALVQPPNPLPALGLNVTLGPFSVLNPPTAWMGVYGVGYIVLTLVLAALSFARRDL
jgi:ABC-type transport system involved in multi-copper enzyme maturation permease subunit